MKCSPSSFACFGEIKIQIATEIVLISTLLVLYVNFSLLPSRITDLTF